MNLFEKIIRTQPNIKNIEFDSTNPQLFVASFEIIDKNGSISYKDIKEIKSAIERARNRKIFLSVDYSDIFVGVLRCYLIDEQNSSLLVRLECEFFGDGVYARFVNEGLKNGSYVGFSFSGCVTGGTLYLSSISLISKQSF